MYQHDPFLDDLLHRPMQMAMNDDEYDEYDDEYDDEDDDDLFGDDVLQAVQDERAAEEKAAEDFAASLLGEQPEQEAAEEVAEVPPEQAKLFTRPGIRRNLIGYTLMTLFGFVPFVLLLIFGAAAGLGKTMMLFSVLMFFGLVFSAYNLFYSFQHGYEFTVSFNVRTFFRFWPEVLVISVILLTLGFWNLGRMSSGTPLTLSGKAIPHTMSPDKNANADQASNSEVVYSSFDKDKHMDEANSVTGSAVAVAGANRMMGDDFNKMFSKPVAGGVVGGIGAYQMPSSMIPKGMSKSNKPTLKTDNPLINSVFLGGPLCAAFGYALIVGLAGAIFGAMRKFETPFSQKVVEIINIESGEVTSDRQPIAPIMNVLNIASKVLMGLYYGATMGFILGLGIILPLFIFMRGGLSDPMMAPLLNVLGLTNQPDLSFTAAVSLAGIMVPLVMMTVGKLAPQGMSVSEELMRQHYEIKPTGRFIAPDSPIVDMSNPAAISFGGGMVPLIPDDELETELANTRLMDELAQEDDNLTAEIIEEFGRDFESVFGIDTRELISAPHQRQATVDRRKLATALDESFGELGNVPVEVSAELGQAHLPITEWLNLREGTLVLLDKPANEEIDILFNGVRKGKGKLIVDEDSLAVKVSQTHFQSGDGSLI